MTKPQKFVLIHTLAPGDVAVMTALVRDIQLNYPGMFQVDVDTSAKDLWRHNPYLTPGLKDGPRTGVRFLKLKYGDGLRRQNHETVHFLSFFHRDFQKQTGIPVKVMRPYPDLHLSDDERIQRPVDQRYWVVISGGKSDFTAKVWETRKFQEVVYQLRGMGLGVVQVGSTDNGHWHPALDGALNLVGKTNLRDLIRLIHHADGVICGVTAAMHIAAALQRPCVVLAGGREAWYWEAYCRENAGLGGCEMAATMPVPHRFLHTIGLLDCCAAHGCWKNKVVPINNDPSLCKYPVQTPGQPVPKCLHMIQPSHVTEAVMSYYTDKTLPPIDVRPEEVHAAIVSQPPEALQQLPVPSAAEKRIPGLTQLAAENPGVTITRTSSPNGRQLRTQVRVPPELLPKLIGNLEGRRGPVPTQAATRPGKHFAIDASAFDHPDVGGKFTIFVLLYGGEEYFDMHQQCLGAIIASVDPQRMDLRVGSNQLNAKSMAFVESLRAKGIVTKHYAHPENAYKYPVMREMFRDPDHPITTKWVLWFDDDSIADANPNWLNILAQAIVLSHRKENAHMFGARRVWSTTERQRKVMEARPWFRKREWRTHQGRPAPNGTKIIFATGGFWAATYEAIIAADIPDLGTGLTHTGGDWQIGEQLYQAGFGLKNFNGEKQFVRTSAYPRRGVTMPTPGATTAYAPPQRQIVRTPQPPAAPAAPPAPQPPRITATTRKPVLLLDL